MARAVAGSVARTAGVIAPLVACRSLCAVILVPAVGDSVVGGEAFEVLGPWEGSFSRAWSGESGDVDASGQAFGAAVGKHLEGAVGVGVSCFEAANDGGEVFGIDDNTGCGCSIKYIIALFDYVCTCIVVIRPMDSDRICGYVEGDNITHGIASRQGGETGGVALGAYVVVYAAAVGFHPHGVGCFAGEAAKSVNDGSTVDGYVVFIDINSNLAIVNVNFAVDNFPCSGAVVLGPAEIHGVSGNAIVIVGQAGGSVASGRSGEGFHTAFGTCGGATVAFHLHIIGGFGIKIVEHEAGGGGRILFDKSGSTSGNLDVVHIDTVVVGRPVAVFFIFPLESVSTRAKVIGIINPVAVTGNTI